jgi:3-deoxy-manno-octulosonate cytidylyltransferase (CMP-KDO synthetase)
MTSSAARNGTERCAETIRKIQSNARLVINLQGDSPMVVSAHIKALIAHWQRTGAPVCSPYICCDADAINKLTADIAKGRPGGVFVDTDAAENAIGFSRQPPSKISPNQNPLKLHIGLYAYTPAALERYTSMPPSTAELSLGLEQLRYLDNGFPIEMVEVTAANKRYADVNYPHDVAIVEHLLQA